MEFIKNPLNWRVVLTTLVLIGISYYLGAVITHSHAQDQPMNSQYYYDMGKDADWSAEVNAISETESLDGPIYIVNMNNCSIEDVVVYGVIWNNKEYLMAVSPNKQITLSNGTPF